MINQVSRIPDAIIQRWAHYSNNRRVEKIAYQVAGHTPPANQAPVIFFNASTRLQGMSLNAAFSLLTSWAVQLQGAPVVHFVCQAGMPHCMLGSVLNGPTDPPPCAVCTAQSRKFFGGMDVRWFQFNPSQELADAASSLSLTELESFQYNEIPLGDLVLPAIRWVLRRHHLQDNEETRYLFRQYILAAEGIARQFENLIEAVKPQKVVVFNGMSFPEATARWVAQKHGKTVFTHEVGLSPYTAYFTSGHATAYPIEIPEDFQLNEKQNRKLDQYLDQRFQGNFSMAGVRFWPTMKALSESFLEHAEKFRQIVPVLTNVIFDTSQAHANVVFKHMFDWLDSVYDLIKTNPDTLFVIRAHPDEARPGKASRESVADWAKSRGVSDLENVVFVDSTEYFSSYQLIQRSKFAMIYNSTIGMEATLLGVPVLCAAKSRFTQLPTVYFPKNKADFIKTAQDFLNANQVELPAEFPLNVRRFLYTQLYRVSIPFSDYIEEDQVWKGYVRLKDINWQDLLPENSPTFKVLTNGILNDQPIVMDV